MDEIAPRDASYLRDPNRRWLRHTYQEGPGFRFLATRGGRPPSAVAQRSALATVRERARFVRLAREGGVAAALAAGCTRRSLFRWQAAYRGGGLAALVPDRRGPRVPAFRHPAWLEQVVIAVRLHTYWNAKRISAELRRREIALVGQWWIERLFDDLGTARPSTARRGGPRYERSAPNSLWHIDIKGPFFIQLGPDRRYLKTWIFGLVDDHSRYILGLRIARGREIEGILVWLRDCIELCGRPLDLMSDNGTEFVHWMPGMLNRFGKTLRELEIRQIKTQVNTPWTNGKIESFWATLKGEVLDREVFRSLADAEAALERFARYYNYHRLHGEIGWLTPAERFDGTPFTDRGFEHIPALAHLIDWLDDVRKAA